MRYITHMPSLMTTRETAKKLKVAPSTVARMVHRGELPMSAKAPGRRGAMLFSPADVQALADRRQASAERLSDKAAMVAGEEVLRGVE